RRALTAQRDIRSKRNHKGSDCFVECCASAISLLFPLCPLPVDTMHLTIGFFRGGKCPQMCAPDGIAIIGECAPATGAVVAPSRLAYRAATSTVRRLPPLPCSVIRTSFVSR